MKWLLCSHQSIVAIVMGTGEVRVSSSFGGGWRRPLEKPAEASWRIRAAWVGGAEEQKDKSNLQLQRQAESKAAKWT